MEACRAAASDATLTADPMFALGKMDSPARRVKLI